jgi:hypothetical protein
VAVTRITTTDALLERMARQGLAPRIEGDAASAARTSAGLQAQDLAASRLAVRARAAGADERSVAAACDTDRTVVRTWLMRGTLHMVPAEDVRWMVALFGPPTAQRDRTRRYQLGVTDEICAAAMSALPDVLAAGALTRRELIDALRERGVAVEPAGQAPAHLVLYTSAMGLTCRGPDIGRDATYVLLDSWLPPGPAGPAGDIALTELARRYFAAFSPATPDDFASWSGLAGARRAAQDLLGDLHEVNVDGKPAWRPGDLRETGNVRGAGDLPGAGDVRLLPAFDSYLLGYRDRDAIIGNSPAKRIYAGGGWIHPAVIVDGRIVGTWKSAKTKRNLVVSVELFMRANRSLRTALEEETDDVGRFYGLPAVVQLEPAR